MLACVCCIFIGWVLGVAAMWRLVAGYERKIKNLEQELRYRDERSKRRDLELTTLKTHWAKWRRKHRRLGC